MNVETYRALVRNAVPCPLCKADIDEWCLRLSPPEGPHRGAQGAQGPSFYVHDDRSAAYHEKTLNDHAQQQQPECKVHCYENERYQSVPAIEPPEGGWPVNQRCKHCGAMRVRKVVFQELPKWASSQPQHGVTAARIPTVNI